MEKNILDQSLIKRLFSYISFKRLKIHVSTDYLLKAEHIYRFIYMNGIPQYMFMELMGTIGIDIIHELVINNRVRNFAHMLRIIRVLKNTLKEWTNEAFDESPLITLKTIQYIMREFNRRKLKLELQDKFMQFIYDNHKIVLDAEKCLLDREDIDKMFKYWYLMTFKAKTLEELEKKS